MVADRTRYASIALTTLALFISSAHLAGAEEPTWKRHVVFEGSHNTTAVAADFTGDGLVDVISNSNGKTWLFVAPDYKAVTLGDDPDHRFIHSAVMDVDGDGDQDFIGARYNPGLIVWFECPDQPLTDRWTARLVDDRVHGIHGLLVADIDADGQADLLATSAQPKPPYPNSLAWFKIPKRPRQAARWQPSILAKQDAPGLTHYLGAGDIDGDGRVDVCTGAKGGPQAEPGTGEWFAWWQAPADPLQTWTKRLVADKQPGATNIHPARINADQHTDLVASRGHGRGVVWFEGPDWKEHTIDPQIKEPHCLVVADLDQDGDIDAATCAFGDQVAAWYENDGSGKFQIHVIGRNQEAYDIRAVDMDGDQDLDLLVAGRGSRNVVWYENPLKRDR